MEKTDSEIIIKLPLNYSNKDAQDVVDYLNLINIKTNNEQSSVISILKNEEETNLIDYSLVDSKILEKLNSDTNLQGILSHYANPELRKLEKKALENAIMSEKE